MDSYNNMRLGENDFKKKYEECITYIDEINNIWFESESDQRTCFYKKLSNLFVLGYRLEEEKRRQLFEKIKKNTMISDNSLSLIRQAKSAADLKRRK